MAPAARLRVGTWCDKAQGKEWKPNICSARSAPGSVGVEMPLARAYNPGTGMFHTLNSSTVESMVSNSNGSFRSIEHFNDFGSVTGSGSEYDTVSKNGSCSGESEDQSLTVNGKDRKGQVPGVVGEGSDNKRDNKRDKIRCKNEKKHQRQKERRAQELRDRCMGYLMSRKLEGLSQQLIAMGFSPDRATMALILNKGVVEDSVAWLLEGGEGQVKSDWNADGSLKLDISEELARITDLESSFKYLRVEIERAVVAFEGDLDKAAEWLHDRQSRRGHEYGSRTQDTGEEQIPFVGSSRYSMTIQGLEYQSVLSSSPVKLDGTYSMAKVRPRSFTDWQRLSACVDGKMTNPLVRNLPQPVPLVRSGRHGLDSRAPSPQENGYPPGREQGLHSPARDSIGATQYPQSPRSPASNVRSTSISPFLSPSSWNGNVAGTSSPSSVLGFNGSTADPLFKGVPSIKSKGVMYSSIAANEYGKAQPSKSKNVLYSSIAAEEHGKTQPLPEILSDLLASAWGTDSNSSLGGRDSSHPAASVSGSTSHRRTQSAPRFLPGWGSCLLGGPGDRSIWVSSGSDNGVSGTNAIDWSTGASLSTISVSSPWGISGSFASVLNPFEGGNPGLVFSGDGMSQEHKKDKEAVGRTSDLHTWDQSNRGIPSGRGLQELPMTERGSGSGRGVPEWTSPFAGKDLFTLPHSAVPAPSVWNG